MEEHILALRKRILNHVEAKAAITSVTHKRFRNDIACK